MGAVTTKKKPLVPADILADPVAFTAACWPEIRLYQKQKDVLSSLVGNVTTLVHAANEVGKDFIASIAVVWFFSSRTPARVITSSSGETQLKSILWSEINQRVGTSRLDLGFKMGVMEIKKYRKDGSICPLSYVIGHVTKTVENFHGHHLDHDIPRVLFVGDEASGIADEFDEAAESWYHRALYIGNPMNTVNFFYRDCKKGNMEDPAGEAELLRSVIHIDGDDSPNVQVARAILKRTGAESFAELGMRPPTIIPGVLSYDEYVRREAKWDARKKQIRLHGLFYEGEEAMLFPTMWMDGAEEEYCHLCPKGYEASGHARQATAMGVDCGAGRDLSVWTIIDRLGLLYQFSLVTPDTAVITTTTQRLMKEYGISAERVCFDAGGGGRQVVDHMRLQDPHAYRKLRTVGFGNAATPPPQRKVHGKQEAVEAKETSWVYKNMRAEMHGILRTWIDPNMNERPFAIPEELYQLREELACLPLWWDKEGKMFLPPKDREPDKKENPDAITIKKILGRSPDRADSLVLAVYALAKKTKRTVGAMR